MATQKKRLWRIGYWIQNWNDPDHIAPQEFVGTYHPDTKRRLVDYLLSGQRFISFCGCSWCRFPQCDVRQNGSYELSGGHWVWPSGLAHYVERHDVLLPVTFVDQVLSGIQTAPKIDHREWTLDMDTLWWTEWCRDNRSGAVGTHMKRLNPRVQCEALEAIVKVRRTSDADFSFIKTAEDLSTSTCIFKDCQRPSTGRLAHELCCVEHVSDWGGGASRLQSAAHQVYGRYLDLVLRRATHEVESDRHRRGEVDKIP